MHGQYSIVLVNGMLIEIIRNNLVRLYFQERCSFRFDKIGAIVSYKTIGQRISRCSEINMDFMPRLICKGLTCIRIFNLNIEEKTLFGA